MLPMPPRIAAAKSGKQQVEAHVGPDLDGDPDHDAGGGGKRAAEQPGRADDAADVDADDGGERRVLGNRPHRAADGRPAHQEEHRDDENERERQRQELVGRHANAGAEPHRDLNVAAEIGRLRGEDELEQAAQRHRRAEARHHHDDGVAARSAAD